MERHTPELVDLISTIFENAYNETNADLTTSQRAIAAVERVQQAVVSDVFKRIDKYEGDKTLLAPMMHIALAMKVGTTFIESKIESSQILLRS